MPDRKAVILGVTLVASSQTITHDGFGFFLARTMFRQKKILFQQKNVSKVLLMFVM